MPDDLNIENKPLAEDKPLKKTHFDLKHVNLEGSDSQGSNSAKTVIGSNSLSEEINSEDEITDNYEKSQATENNQSEADLEEAHFPNSKTEEKLEAEAFEPGSIKQLKVQDESPKPIQKTGPFTKVRGFLKKHRRFITLSLLALFLLGVGGITVSSLWLINRYNNLEDVVSQATAIDEGSIVYDRNNKELFRFNNDGVEREIISIGEIPEEMKAAIVALEDENFYKNPVGIPWQNMIGAAGKCFFSGGETCRGGSGLSQQLIKNVTGENSPTTGRKINELLAAIKFNREVGETEVERQDKALELYLNWVPFGRNTYGVQAASRSYFGKDVKAGLTIPESCYLASMVQRPSTYAQAIEIEIGNRQAPETPVANPNWEVLEGRKNACIQKLSDLNLKNRGTEKLISPEVNLEELKNQKTDFKPRPVTNLVYGHLQNYITEELENNLEISDLGTKGYRIYTTFDKDVQDKAQEIIQQTAQKRIVDNGGNNGSAVVLDGPTGEVLAMIGSRDFNDESIGGQVNVATAARQPGSSYKPYVYASAFENGFNPGTVLLDVSTDFGGYRPANFSRNFSGATTIRKSLADSLNIPAVKAAYLSQSGGRQSDTNEATQNMLTFSEKVGVNHPFRDTCTLSAAIGSCELSPLSHAVGINTLLQEGKHKAPKVFKRIILKDRLTGQETDELRVKNPPAYIDKGQVIKPEAAKQIANVMSDYGARSPSVWGNERRTLELDGWTGANQVAAKTGTTNDVKDTWTVGGSPLYTVVVWVGNTDGKPMNSRALSTQTAGTTWKDIMTFLHADKPKVGFSTEGLKTVSLDPLTGLLGSGKTEILSQEQENKLKEAQTNLDNPAYEPNKNSIIQNRSPIVSRKVLVSKLDGKLLAKPLEGQAPTYPAEIAEEKICVEILSEFPTNGNWLQNAAGLTLNLTPEVQNCPTEFSDLDPQASGPQIDTNLDSSTTDLPKEIRIIATSKSATATITRISFLVGAIEVAFSENQSSLNINLESLNLSGVKDVTIKATDSLGLTSEVVFQGLNFEIPKSSSSSSKNGSSGSAGSSGSKASSGSVGSGSSSDPSDP